MLLSTSARLSSGFMARIISGLPPERRCSANDASVCHSCATSGSTMNLTEGGSTHLRGSEMNASVWAFGLKCSLSCEQLLPTTVRKVERERGARGRDK